LIVVPARATPSTDTRRRRTASMTAMAVLGERAHLCWEASPPRTR
jgi:hypothetical protein